VGEGHQMEWQGAHGMDPEWAILPCPKSSGSAVADRRPPFPEPNPLCN
jgi:hypothetical protein